MLKVGQQRAAVQGLDAPGKNIAVEWVEGNAESLPFADSTYDSYTIAFGIRNCTNVDKGAQSFTCCLSFSVVPVSVVRVSN